MGILAKIPSEPSPFVGFMSLHLREPVHEARRVWNLRHAGPMTRDYVRAYCYWQGFDAIRPEQNPYPADLITHFWWLEGLNHPPGSGRKQLATQSRPALRMAA